MGHGEWLRAYSSLETHPPLLGVYTAGSGRGGDTLSPGGTSYPQHRSEVLVRVTQVGQVAPWHHWEKEVTYKFLGTPQMNQNLQEQGLSALKTHGYIFA